MKRVRNEHTRTKQQQQKKRNFKKDIIHRMCILQFEWKQKKANSAKQNEQKIKLKIRITKITCTKFELKKLINNKYHKR